MVDTRFWRDHEHKTQFILETKKWKEQVHSKHNNHTNNTPYSISYCFTTIKYFHLSQPVAIIHNCSSVKITDIWFPRIFLYFHSAATLFSIPIFFVTKLQVSLKLYLSSLMSLLQCAGEIIAVHILFYVIVFLAGSLFSAPVLSIETCRRAFYDFLH